MTSTRQSMTSIRKSATCCRPAPSVAHYECPFLPGRSGPSWALALRLAVETRIPDASVRPPDAAQAIEAGPGNAETAPPAASNAFVQLARRPCVSRTWARFDNRCRAGREADTILVEESPPAGSGRRPSASKRSSGLYGARNRGAENGVPEEAQDRSRDRAKTASRHLLQCQRCLCDPVLGRREQALPRSLPFWAVAS
jgi:hypothetical protein